MANIAPEFSPVVSSQSYQVVPEELYTQPETTTVDLEDDIKFGDRGWFLLSLFLNNSRLIKKLR